MLHILNSAVMPAEGNYTKIHVTPRQWRRRFSQAVVAPTPWKSYIGYPETARVLSNFLEIRIPISRETTVIKDGDILMVARLTYRVADPSKKGKNRNLGIEDFEFSIVEFSELGEKR